MVCTQNGSKSLQVAVEECIDDQNYLSSDDMSEQVRTMVVDEIVKEVAPTGPKIICDTFGNYFYQVQKSDLF